MKPLEILSRSLIAGAIVVTDVLFMVLLAMFASGAGHGIAEILELLVRNLELLTLLSLGLGALAFARRARTVAAGGVLFLLLWPFAAYLLIPGDDLIQLGVAFDDHPMLAGFWACGVFVVRIGVIGLGSLFMSNPRRD